jgi:hypothetical protein
VTDWPVQPASVDHVTSSFELLDSITPEARRPNLEDEGIDEVRLAAEGVTTVTTWSPIRDEASKKRLLLAIRAAI